MPAIQFNQKENNEKSCLNNFFNKTNNNELKTKKSLQQYGGGPIGTLNINLDAKAKYNQKNNNSEEKREKILYKIISLH